MSKLMKKFSEKPSEIEDAVNTWLSKYGSIRILDIKFHSTAKKETILLFYETGFSEQNIIPVGHRASIRPDDAMAEAEKSLLYKVSLG